MKDKFACGCWADIYLQVVAAVEIVSSSAVLNPAARCGVSHLRGRTYMLLAYLDEVGEPGAFVSKEHPKYNTSGAFGYAGFIIPENHVRAFGAAFCRSRNIFSD